MVAVGYTEELVGEHVLGHDDTRRVRRADGEHGRRAFRVLHSPAVVHSCGGALVIAVGAWFCWLRLNL